MKNSISSHTLPAAQVPTFVRAVARRLAQVLAITFVIALAQMDQAMAETIRGHIIRSNPSSSNSAGSSDVSLKLAEEPDLVVTIQGPSSVLNSLKRLKNGDLIVGQGWLSRSAKTVRLDSIQSLGLQDLLGAWQSENWWEIFFFTDFNRLDLYIPRMTDGQEDVTLQRTHALGYYVTPEGSDRYSIFIADPKRVMAGSFKLNDNRITLSVFDPKTGAVKENLSLSPIRMK